MKHPFTVKILEILEKNFPADFEQIYNNSELLNYINFKTKSANRGSKSRGSFGAIYSIYTLVEDYIQNGFHKNREYSNFEGATQTYLIRRQRELPFGGKLQNHYFQNRTNSEYKKTAPLSDFERIIIHDQKNSRYWINESLLNLIVNGKTFNIAESVIEILNAYIEAKKNAFDRFIVTCEQLKSISNEESEKIIEFISGLLAPNIDARIFEIVSYSILKFFYSERTVFFGFELDSIEEENLKLYKTGRTNANDGGIDFVMKPIGTFFQVTETTDTKKYFLDIDKLEKFPITFVIKSVEPIDTLKEHILQNAKIQYTVQTIVKKYMDCVEEIINIPELYIRFQEATKQGHLNDILAEILIQSKVEFNYEDVDLEETD